jgi:superoxide reductase
MVNINDIYKCEICGNIIESVHGGNESLFCCGQAMKKMEPQSGPDGQEKHLPVIEKSGNKIIVKIGSIPHPMIEEHFIEWIEIICGNKVQRTFLHPNDEPVAEFVVADINESITARAYCNIHGLWINAT